jgi:hypothetical protein
LATETDQIGRFQFWREKVVVLSFWREKQKHAIWGEKLRKTGAGDICALEHACVYKQQSVPNALHATQKHSILG